MEWDVWRGREKVMLLQRLRVRGVREAFISPFREDSGWSEVDVFGPRSAVPRLWRGRMRGRRTRGVG
jgi:hypothetical protein